jgi:hypothetical protein
MENVNPKYFASLLNKGVGEHTLSKYLARNPWILYWTFCPASGHMRYLFREFPLGSSYKADFVILNADSVSWQATFIELEPSTSTVFNRSRTPSKRLASALCQISDWKIFVDNNQDFIRKTYFDWIRRKDLLKYSDPITRSEDSYYNILNPESVIEYDYSIVIGRRPADKYLSHNPRARFRSSFGIDIVSYDRLLDLSRYRYKEKK